MDDTASSSLPDVDVAQGAAPPPPPGDAPLEVTVYQIVGDDMLAKNRSDGTGWELQWADLKREWMEKTSNKFAYRCLPLTIANQLGFWVLNPVGFTAKWLGAPDVVEFRFDKAGDFWGRSITNHFKYGIVTWNTPFLFRTRPVGSRVLITGAPNRFKHNAHPLTGLIESDWMVMSFTMNWQIMRPHEEVRFERGEPIFQAIPLARNPCLDLERAKVVYRRLDDDPALAAEYRTWVESRAHFHKLQVEGKVSQDDWQKHYFRGVTLEGGAAPTTHHVKIRFPEIEIATAATPPTPAAGRPPIGYAFRADGEKPEKKRPERGEKTAAEPRAPAEHAPTAIDIAGPAAPLKLRVFRVHPRGSRIAAAEAGQAGEARAADLAPGSASGRANALGWWVFPPFDLDVTWLGGRAFEKRVATPLDDEDEKVVKALGPGLRYDAPKKLAFGDDGEGVITLWTGLVVETPPGWALEVRSPVNVALAPHLRIREEVLECERTPRELTVRLRVLETGRPVELRAGAPWPPLAQLVPVRRETFDAEWLLGHVPLGKAAANAAQVYEKWMRGRE